MAITNIDYDEPNTKTYKSVGFSFNENGVTKSKVFNSGNFIKDWFDHNKFIAHLDEEQFAFMNSSSVDHFIMDGAPFDSMYLEMIDGKASFTKKGDGVEFFVSEGTTPTWDELKEFCKD